MPDTCRIEAVTTYVLTRADGSRETFDTMLDALRAMEGDESPAPTDAFSFPNNSTENGRVFTPKRRYFSASGLGSNGGRPSDGEQR